MLSEILEKFQVKYEDLEVPERKTINDWMQALEQSQLTMEKVKESIHAMRIAVEQELCKTDNRPLQDVFLKARLQNYMLIEALLTSPDRARQQFEAMLSNLKPK